MPTIHQAILTHTASNRAVIAHCALRFIRSASAPLPAWLSTALEHTFHAPVLEAYGMTEAASQVACNPLPPRVRKMGSVGEIRQFAATRLADVKVPHQVLLVPTIPQGPSGKLQRPGLAEWLGLVVSGRVESQPSFVAPRTPVEEIVAGLWTQLLQVDRVGIHDNFFELGGDSILAMQVIARVREALRVEWSTLSFLQTPTVSAMANNIETARQTNQNVSTPPLRRLAREKILPLSMAQEQLWLLDRLLPGTSFFNVRYVLHPTPAGCPAAQEAGGLSGWHKICPSTVAGRQVSGSGPSRPRWSLLSARMVAVSCACLDTHRLIGVWKQHGVRPQKCDDLKAGVLYEHDSIWTG